MPEIEFTEHHRTAPNSTGFAKHQQLARNNITTADGFLLTLLLLQVLLLPPVLS